MKIILNKYKNPDYKYFFIISNREEILIVLELINIIH